MLRNTRPARGRGQQRGQDLDQGRLARTVRSQQAKQLALPDLQVHALQRNQLLAALALLLVAADLVDAAQIFHFDSQIGDGRGSMGIQTPSKQPKTLTVL